jgi:hypothetical protein
MKSPLYWLSSVSAAALLCVAVAAHSTEKSSVSAAEKTAAAGKPDCENGGRHGRADHGDRHGRDEDRADFDKAPFARAPFEKILDLTDAQQKTLEAAREKAQASAGDLRQKMIAAQEAVFKAAESNASDEELTKLLATSASLRTQLELGHIKMHRQLVAILTPEQKQKLTEWETQHHRDRRERI